MAMKSNKNNKQSKKHKPTQKRSSKFAKKSKPMSKHAEHDPKAKSVGDKSISSISEASSMPSERQPSIHKKLARKDRERLKNPEKYDLADKIKQIWEELRSSSLPADKRSSLTKKLLETIKGNAAKMVNAHDTSRVLQTLLKYGSAEQRDEIFEEMKPSFAAMMAQKYANFYLLKVLEYGSSTHRHFIVKCIIGNTRRLLKNPNASKVIEEVFSKYAKPNERRQLVGDLCGATFRRLMVKGDESFKDIFCNAPDDETKDRLLRSLKSALVALASYGKGRVAQFSIVHAALDEFLSNCPADNSLRREVIDAWRDNLHGLLSTKIGARCAQHFVWESNPKERKVLVKGLKPIITRLCSDADATMFLLSIFDSLDDVVLANKYIVKVLLGSGPNSNELDEEDATVADNISVGCIEENFMNPVTRRLLLYILSPRDPHHFSPAFIEQLKSPVLPNGLATGNKKNWEERLSDLRRVSKVDEILLKMLIKNMPLLIKDFDNEGLLTLTTMLNSFESCDGLRAQAFGLFALLIEPNNEQGEVLSIESPAMSMGIKKLISGDKQRFSSGVLVSELFVSKFADRFLKSPASIVPSFLASNRGCYALLSVVECGIDEVSAQFLQCLKKFIAEVRAQHSSGAKLLLQKLS